MDQLSGAVAAKVSVEFATRIAPNGIAKLTNWVKGKEIIVVGQPRSGKSSLIKYLQNGVLLTEQPTEKTMTKKNTPTFAIKIGREGSLEMKLRSIMDCPGQVYAEQHAHLVYEKRPHVLVIVLDSSSPFMGEQKDEVVVDQSTSDGWLQSFCNEFDRLWQQTDKKSRNRLRSIVVLSNKTDKISPAIFKARKTTYEKITNTLSHAKPRNPSVVTILPTVLVDTDEGTKSADEVIKTLAVSLQ